MKKRYLQLVLCFACLLLFSLIVSHLSHQNQTFDAIFPELEQAVSCHIFSIDTTCSTETTLTGAELYYLMDKLREPFYDRDGPAESVIEGTLYHLIFDMEQSEDTHIMITDAGKLYTVSWRYSIRPDDVSAYIEKLLLLRHGSEYGNLDQ